MNNILTTSTREVHSEILFCENALSRLPKENAMVFCDRTVLSLYGKEIKENLKDLPVSAMEAGEKHKNAQTIEGLLNAMAAAGLTRTSTLLVVGGGVPCDLGGLAAALYMRGISCSYIPTTLLAQVDASVGGKTAIDFAGVKNLVGAFSAPKQVLIDPAFLRTLPAREIRCGLGEMIKHAALDGALFDEIEKNETRLTDLEFLSAAVPKHVAFKAGIVERDPFESGLRKCLNLGHTTAHALDDGTGRLTHGEFVLLGILVEAEIAMARCDCDINYLARLKELAKTALGEIPSLPSVEDAVRRAAFDKKNASKNAVTLVVPVKKGTYQTIALSVEEYAQELRRAIERLC